VQSALAGRPAVSDVLLSRVTGRPVVMLAVPITAGGTTVGALVARLDGNALSAITNEMGFGESGYAYLIDRQGVVAAHPDASLVLDRFAPIEAAKTDASLSVLAGVVEKIIRGGSGSDEYNFKGKDIIIGYVPVEGSEFILAVAAQKKEFQSGIADLRNVFLLATLACVAVGVVVSVLIGRSVSAPVSETARILGEINAGDGDLTRRLSVRTKDEVAALAGNFNAFVDGLHGLIVAVRGHASGIGEIGNDLAANMTETSSAIYQIMANIESVKNQVVDQAAGVDETLATVEQITRNIESFNGRIDDQAANVNQASASIEQLVASIRSVSKTLEDNSASIGSLQEASSAGKDKLSAVVDIIKEIGLAAEGMLEASSVIGNIASQTNLLSMNAAIEAAHAGDAGKGFAVVADEIRKLSDNSNEQSKSINAVLNAIKKSIDAAVEFSLEADRSFDGVLEKVKVVSDQESEIKNAMHEQSVGGGQVLEAVTGINHITNEIHGGSAEILLGSKTILDEMNRLTRITQEINQSVLEMAGGAREISESVTHVSELSVRNKDSARELMEQVAKFKVGD
ncbi:MAG: HAMP domain-containing protein, partial [Spirochaetes bacterium]|nr:HAMP domain-containing protein [Spirochaetota bacterium]